MNDRPIGVFDSGVGGLTVLKRFAEELPNENYIYFGDTARIPYGEKTRAQLFDIVVEILDWFKYKNIKAVIMACNTSSAVVLEEIKNNYDFPIFGLIQPTAEYIAYSDIKKVGVIATTATVNSKAYSKAINKFSSDIEVIETACPGLVEIVENNKIQTYEAKDLVIRYIMPFIEEKVEKIILGCTHYPYLSEIINSITVRDDLLVDPGEHLTLKVAEDLIALDLLNSSSIPLQKGKKEFFVSSSTEMFSKVGRNFYKDIEDVKQIDIKSELSNLACYTKMSLVFGKPAKPDFP